MKTRMICFLASGVLLVLSACSPPVQPPPESAPGGAGAETEAVGAEVEPAGPELPADGALPAFDEFTPEEGSWMYWFDNNILLYIPAGEFPLGSTEFEDNPPHNVGLGGFWIYRYPVTNDMYRLCVAAGACDNPATEPPYEDVFDPKRKDHPVVGVDWDRANAYCQWMGAELPTEAQWEAAARGPLGSTYPWGEDDPSCKLLNYQGCKYDTSPVVAYYPQGMSYFELMDMAGNTFEWTYDWYQENYFSSEPLTDPIGPQSGSFRSVRSSGFDSTSDMLPLARRAYLQPAKYRVDLGFRCVVTEPAHFAPYCEQIAYIPGENKGPGQPPPGDPDHPLHQVPQCNAPAPFFQVGGWCYDQQNQLGGATVTYTGDLQSVNGATCTPGNPMGCWGPENASFDVVICTQCIDWVPPDWMVPTCDPGYYLDGDTCKFDGIPAIPATNCPPGWFLDADGFCHPFVAPSDPECPDGFSYDPTAKCCTATYIEPSGGWAGVPPNSYSSCPVGYDYMDPPGVCLFAGQWVVGQDCPTLTGQLGNCRDLPPDGGCENPGSYGDQASCEAAGCKWNPPATGGPGGTCSN